MTKQERLEALDRLQSEAQNAHYIQPLISGPTPINMLIERERYLSAQLSYLQRLAGLGHAGEELGLQGDVAECEADLNRIRAELTERRGTAANDEPPPHEQTADTLPAPVPALDFSTMESRKAITKRCAGGTGGGKAKALAEKLKIHYKDLNWWENHGAASWPTKRGQPSGKLLKVEKGLADISRTL